MIDLHCHILPDVDDGSKTMAMSVEMAKIYLKNGIKEIIATPHYIEGDQFSTFEENKVVCEKFKDVLQRENIDLKVYLGQEIFLSPDIMKYLEEGRVGSLNGSKYVLTELAMVNDYVHMENVIYEFLMKGYIPVIAHPERYKKIQDDPNVLYEYIRLGALAQMNIRSLEGMYGDKAMNTAEILAACGMYQFVGTDAHSDEGRSPEVGKSLEILKGIVSEKEFERITFTNSKALLENKDIIFEEPKKYEGRKKGILFRLKSKVSLF